MKYCLHSVKATRSLHLGQRVLARIESLEERRLLSALLPGFGIYNAAGRVKLDYDRTGTINANHKIGSAGSQIVAADFNGDTLTDTAAFLNGAWSIDYNNDGTIDKTVQFGQAGDLAIAGDITGNGTAALGTYNPTTGLWQFSANQDGNVSSSFQDQPGGIPLLADWNNSGHDDLILYKAGTWTVTDPSGTLITTFQLGGAPGDIPVVADYNGDGQVDPGIFNAGQWKFDTNRDGTFDATYKKGNASTKPLVGYFDPSNSIFVAAGGNGDGSLGHPLGTIEAALNKATNGSIVRIAPGNYAENDYLFNAQNLTVVGAGMDATHIDPSSGDALTFDRGSNTYVYNLNVDSGDRGLIVLGGSIFLRGLSTSGTVNTGTLSVNYQGVNATIDAQNCSFNNVVEGMGFWMQDGSTLTATNSTFDSDGTNPALASNDTSHGIGLQINGTCTATCQNCDFSHNHANGLSVFGTDNVTVNHSSLSFNFAQDGAVVSGDVTAAFHNDTFQQNGPVRSVTLGAYGVEITNTYVGPGVIVRNSTFRNNTAAGIFIGNGTGHQIINNVFNNNVLGVSINGFVDPGISTLPVNTSAMIVGNIFKVPVGATNVTGVFALGSGAGGVVGGDGANANKFKNYAGDLNTIAAISLSNFGGFNPPQIVGSPTTMILLNDYVNSPNPINMVVES